MVAFPAGQDKSSGSLPEGLSRFKLNLIFVGNRYGLVRRTRTFPLALREEALGWSIITHSIAKLCAYSDERTALDSFNAAIPGCQKPGGGGAVVVPAR